MDAFYAAVEQRDNPELRGKPILVGPPTGRGVVLTASYEARPFGVGSAMPMSRAIRKCPQAIVVPPRFERYTEASRQVMDVFESFSPDVEPISLDEAFIEMTGSEGLFGTPGAMGRRIKEAVREATGGLTISVGISGTKYVAKVASAFRKPDGLTVVPQDKAKAFLAPLPVSKLWGVGPVTEARLVEAGYTTIGMLAAADPRVLERRLGSAGPHFHRLAHAMDPRRVEGRRSARSVGSERTLVEDTSSRAEIIDHLRRSADGIGRRLRRRKLRARGIRVKLKTSSFQLLTRQRLLPAATDVAARLLEAALPLLDEFPFDEPFRLVGLAAYELVEEGASEQLDLFGVALKQRRLEQALDGLRSRFGAGAVGRASDVGRERGEGPNLDYMNDEEAGARRSAPHPDDPEIVYDWD
jgi:DNA polymerase-4